MKKVSNEQEIFDQKTICRVGFLPNWVSLSCFFLGVMCLVGVFMCPVSLIYRVVMGFIGVILLMIFFLDEVITTGV